jgi:hypothetical protein
MVGEVDRRESEIMLPQSSLSAHANVSLGLLVAVTGFEVPHFSQAVSVAGISLQPGSGITSPRPVDHRAPAKDLT